MSEERRNQLDRRVEPSVIASQLLRRISWEGIAAGSLLALATQLAFMTLGQALKIGAWAEESAAIASGCWLVITSVGGLIPGGWVAARVAGIPSRADSAFHGLFTWAATSLISVRWGALGQFLVSGSGQTAHALFPFLAILSGAAAASVAGWQAAPYDVITHRRDTASVRS